VAQNLTAIWGKTKPEAKNISISICNKDRTGLGPVARPFKEFELYSIP
jgi:hypothetical protein